MAPILSFTAEEIWQYMPDRKGKEASIHLSPLPVANNAWKDEGLAKNWERLLDVRGHVTKSLEEARDKKTYRAFLRCLDYYICR